MRRWLAAAGLVLSVALAGACRTTRDAIVLDGNIITIENQTSREWRNVVVTVNDHFRGGAKTLAAGQVLTAPLSQFETAFGQRFAPARQSVLKIEVAATDAGGEAVTLVWDRKNRAGRPQGE
jgi:hypothetical protein